jgi:hypothetical protein
MSRKAFHEMLATQSVEALMGIVVVVIVVIVVY